ncbi:hypothetical protein E2I00_006689 [Balaenoptera physalus]|uniref:Uncharacterized protein n=1 Tax=Balaenoptera physalus TaxID=9770 RepID=A0A643BLG3_BALPH|nr:hypothetical protein E2I00_006689 [Balaenoptera physalus]
MVICFVYSVWVLLKKCNNQIQKTSYAQHQQVCQICKKMMEIMTQEVQTNDLKEVVNQLIPDSTGKDIEKPCQSIYPLYDVFVRKVKMLKSPSLNWENSWSYMVKVVVLEKLLGMRQVLKLKELMDMSHQSKNLFKNQTFNGDK